MIRRLATLGTAGILVWFLLPILAEDPGAEVGEATFLLGFALLAAALIGEIVEQVRLPRITGYILAGIVFGPYAAGFLEPRILDSLAIFKELAYAFIGLAAGAELKLAVLRGRARSLLSLIVVTSAAVMAGVGLAFLAGASLTGLLGDLGPVQLLGVSGVVGVIAAARSPSSAIAIINETKAEGPFSETILGVSVAMDAVVIFLFSIATALCALAFSPEGGLDLTFVAALTGGILASLILGTALGAGMAAYMRRRGPQIPLVILGLCLLVYRSSRVLSAVIEEAGGADFHLEPLLVCAAAGFTVQNLSRQGERLLEAMEWVALPVYVLFFMLAGAWLDVGAFADTWAVALLIAGCRAAMIVAGTRLATRLAGDPPAFRRYCWLGFITQAGLSLALVAKIAESYPGWGTRLATILVAVIAINQVVGPAAFLFALRRMGEVRRRRRLGPARNAAPGAAVPEPR